MACTNEAGAVSMLGSLLRDVFSIDAHNIAINHDRYSLNSLNGFFETDEGDFFFKFHQEEGEEAMSGEYYRADILAKAGLPVDQPVHMSVFPGEQILIYRRRSDPRFSDVLRALDIEPDADRKPWRFLPNAGFSRASCCLPPHAAHGHGGRSRLRTYPPAFPGADDRPEDPLRSGRTLC